MIDTIKWTLHFSFLLLCVGHLGSIFIPEGTPKSKSLIGTVVHSENGNCIVESTDGAIIQTFANYCPQGHLVEMLVVPDPNVDDYYKTLSLSVLLK